jgi:hypothetical protein
MLSFEEEFEKYKKYAKDEEDLILLKILIDKKQKMAQTHGIFLYTPKNTREVNKIKDLIKVIDNLQWARINNNGTDMILIRTYIVKSNDPINLDEIRNEARHDFNHKDYYKALAKRLKILFSERTVPIKDYYDIAMCYYRMHNWSSAYKYLTIVDSIALDFGMDIDIDEHIEKSRKLQGITNQNTSNNVSIHVDENIKKLVIIDVIDNNEPLNDVLGKFSLSEENKLLIVLSVAKEYYRRGFIAKGDKMIKIVEQSSNKTAEVKKSLNYIRSNKQLIIKKGNK